MRLLFLMLSVLLLAGCPNKPVASTTPSNPVTIPSSTSEEKPKGESSDEAKPVEASPAKGKSADLSVSETEDLSSTDYPWWRGMSRTDIYPPETKAPTAWSEDKNIAWKTPLPGLGHGTPTIVKDRIFLATGQKANEGQNKVTISLLILSRADGKIIKQVPLMTGEKGERLHRDNSDVSATIACDGTRLFLPFLIDRHIWFFCCDWDGENLWKKDLGEFNSEHGFSASPLLYRNLVIVVHDPEKPTWGYLTALDRKTGEIVWRVKRSQTYGFGSPCLIHSGGKDQLIVNGPNITRSYNPGTGEEYWSVEGPTQVNPSSPAWDEETVYLSGGWPKKNLIAVDTRGTGDVTKTHILWHSPRGVVPAYCASLIQKDGVLYCLDDQGTFSVLDAKKGTLHWKEKFQEQFYSSPVVVGDRVYLFGRRGSAWVFKTGATKEKIAENSLGKGVWANPVFLDDGIYLRSLDTLYFIKQP